MSGPINRLVMTGATGFVGRHFLYRLISEDPSIQCTLLLRGESESAARSRIVQLLQRVAKDNGRRLDVASVLSRFSVIIADITRPRCGLSENVVQSLRYDGRTSFWHLAASLNFEESQRERIDAHNIEGASAALWLANALGCSHLVYVSTAYTCGSTSGYIREVLHDVNGSFGNAYERSKCIAERLVAERCTQSGLPYTILRPSIVVGLSTNHLPSGSETGLYGFAREFLRMRRALANERGPIRATGDGATEINLVPVDFVAERMVRLHLQGHASDGIMHLTSDGGPTSQQICDSITDAIGVPRIQFVPVLPPDASPLERILSRRIRFYSSYLKDAKRFAARIGSATAVTVDAVEEYVDRFLQERHADKFALNEQMMKSRDGFSVRIARNERAHNSQRETVVIINAIGMPIATLEKFIAKLSVAYDVLTWESRGVPSPDGTLDEQNARFARHIDDLEDMLATYRVARAHIVGWCTGGDVALEFLNRHPDRVISLVCMNSGFVGICSARVPFQESLAQIIRRVLRSPTYARLYFELMTKTRRGGLDRLAVDESLEASVEETMSHLDEDLMHLTGAPLQTPELFERYCRLLGYYFDEAPRCVPLSSVPVMIVTSEGDELVPYAASVAVAAAFRNSQIHFTTEGGHFAPCISEALAQDVTNFLLRNPVSGIERNESLVGGHENHCLEGVT